MNTILAPLLRQFQRLSVRYLLLLAGIVLAVGMLVATGVLLDYTGAVAGLKPVVSTAYIQWGGMLAALLLLLHTFALWRFMQYQENPDRNCNVPDSGQIRPIRRVASSCPP